MPIYVFICLCIHVRIYSFFSTFTRWDAVLSYGFICFFIYVHINSLFSIFIRWCSVLIHLFIHLFIYVPVYLLLLFTGELEESLRAQFEPTQRRRYDGVTVSMFERHTPGDDRWAFSGGGWGLRALTLACFFSSSLFLFCRFNKQAIQSF